MQDARNDFFCLLLFLSNEFMNSCYILRLMNQDKNPEEVFFLFLSYFPIPILLSWWRCSLESSLPLTAVSFQVGTIHRRWRPPLTRHYSLSLSLPSRILKSANKWFMQKKLSSNRAFLLWIAYVVIWDNNFIVLTTLERTFSLLLKILHYLAFNCFFIRPATGHFEQEKMFVFKHPI